MLIMLKAAGAKESVLKFVQEQFHCDQCVKQHRPIPGKQVTFPRTFSFNHILGIDYFFISWAEKTHAFLNVICQGTNFQQVAMLRNYGTAHFACSDSAAAEFARSQAIRQRARELHQVHLEGQSPAGHPALRTQGKVLGCRPVGVLLAAIFWNWTGTHNQGKVDGSRNK